MLCHTEVMTEIANPEAIAQQKNAVLAERAAQAEGDFRAAQINITHHQPTNEKVATLLATGQQQLRAAADARTLSRQQPYDAFNQAGENRTNVWWQAQFSMAEAALRAEKPTPQQQQALKVVLEMVVRLTEAESDKQVAQFQDNLIIEFGARFLSELSAPTIDTGEQRSALIKVRQKIRTVFTGFVNAMNQTSLDLAHLKQERSRLINNAKEMLFLLRDKLPQTQTVSPQVYS